MGDTLTIATGDYNSLGLWPETLAPPSARLKGIFSLAIAIRTG